MAKQANQFDYNQPIALLGGISVNTFMAEYWQKKPLLVRAAMPQAIDIILPEDLIELALSHADEDADTEDTSIAYLDDGEADIDEEYAHCDTLPTLSTRLISQQGSKGEQWHVNTQPLYDNDFEALPQQWTLLVQAVDHWSPEVGDLWQCFNFIPGWRRDDIMVSYAPQGGSVGKHFDYYDVFLVQSHGQRRWQIGQMCDASTPLVANQPMKLLQQMDVCFDEVVSPGDLLYIPPGMAHYGVAQNDCTTLSFGFRMPSSQSMSSQALDTLLASEQASSIPFADTRAMATASQSGLVSADDITFLQHSWLDSLRQNSTAMTNIVMSLLSSSKFDDVLGDTYSADELKALVKDGLTMQKEPRVRLLYNQQGESVQIWSQSLQLDYPASCLDTLIQLANGQRLGFADLAPTNAWGFWAALLAQGILSIDA